MIGVRYKVRHRFASDTAYTTAAAAGIVGITAGPENFDVVNFTTLNDMMEYPQGKYHKWRYTSRNNVFTEGPGGNSTGRDTGWFRGYLSNTSIRKVYGMADSGGTQQFVYPVDYTAPYGSSPACQHELVIWGQALPQDNAATLPMAYLYADVHLVYYVRWFNPIYPAQS